MGFDGNDLAKCYIDLPSSIVIFTEAVYAIYMGVVCAAMKAYVSKVNTSKCHKVVTSDCSGMLGQLCNFV